MKNLMEALKDENLEALQQMINEGVKLEEEHFRWLFEKSSIKTIKLLLDNNVDIYQYDIATVSVSGRSDVLRFLVENGLDATLRNNYFIRNNAYINNLEMVKFLTEHGADIYVSNNQVFDNLFKQRNVEGVRYLISKGLDINTIDENILSAIAARDSGLEMVKFLIFECGKEIEFFGDPDSFSDQVLDWVKKYQASKTLNENLEKDLSDSSQNIKSNKLKV